MITISMVSFLVGAALAQRFKVKVLVPAIVIFSGFSIVIGGAHAQPAWSIVLMVATTATCLQIGYFVGIYMRHVLEAVLSSSSSSLDSPKTPARHLVH
jgi:NADH:ubiquinone oxidoreductase subunit 6 (subunit J)